MRFYIVLILSLAVFLRLQNLSGNFTIDGDSGRDVMIALEAIRRGEFPLTGPFTSAGPFVFGPVFYWFVIGAYLFLPFGLFSPWVLIFFAGILFVLLMTIIADQLGGKRLALVVGLLAASSPQMVARSRALTQHTLVAITGAWIILCFILLWKRGRITFSFLMGVGLGVAVSLHYQATNLLLFLPAILLISKMSWKKKVACLLLATIGLLLPSLPLLIWDSQQNFANINNILDYFLIGQYRLYVPSSWKLFLFSQFPSYFAFVIGGVLPAGLILFFSSTIRAVWSRGVIQVLAIIYLVLLLLNRYYHGERFEGYLIYFVPFVLLFSGILLEKLGIVVLVVILALNIWATTKTLSTNPNSLASVKETAKGVVELYKDQKLSIYQNNANSSFVAYPLYLVLLNKRLIGEENSIPLGVVLDSSPAGYHLIDLKTFEQWKMVSKAEVYDDLIGWLQKHQLRSSFSLSKYIQEKLP